MAVGAVLLCLMLLLVVMSVLRCERCGELRWTGTRNTDATESLLVAGESHPSRFEPLPRRTFGRTTLDSTVSCVVCMEMPINCVLMPCAHEVACSQCARRLQLCPICRMAVDVTLKVHVADAVQVAQAARDRVALTAPLDLHGVSQASDSEPAGDLADANHEGPHPDLGERCSADDAQSSSSSPNPLAPATGKPQGMAPMLCLRCATNPPNCVFLPCAHKIWCTECASQVRAPLQSCYRTAYVPAACP